MAARTPKHIREKQMTELASADGYTFVGWGAEYTGNLTKVVVNCKTHGDWTTKLSYFTDMRTRCPGCAVQLRRADIDVVRSDIVESCSKKGYEFLGFIDGYVNNSSKVKLRCRAHGEWDAAVSHVLHDATGCPVCGGKQKLLEYDVITRITVAGAQKGFVFGGWVDRHNNNSSKVRLLCVDHGEWTAVVESIIHQKTGCPKCAVFGFVPSKSGTLYALRSVDGDYVKVGISNNFEQRLGQLQKRTPFEFKVLRELKFTNGADAMAAEQVIHKSFPSAGLTGFDGCTEWLEWSPDVVMWADLFSGGACNDQ